jgi:hypothetical protein
MYLAATVSFEHLSATHGGRRRVPVRQSPFK